MTDLVRVVECPRDGWHRLPDFISTDFKAEYLNFKTGVLQTQ